MMWIYLYVAFCISVTFCYLKRHLSFENDMNSIPYGDLNFYEYRKDVSDYLIVATPALAIIKILCKNR